MNYGGHDIILSSTCSEQMLDYITSLRTVADDPVASATFFHESTQAVFDHVLKVGASDGDGGALGNVQAYIGMTEEHFRFSLHAHLLVWVYGYSRRDQLREDLGTTTATIEKDAALAKHVGRIVCNQLMSTEQGDYCLMNGSAPAYSCTDVVQDSSNNADELGGHIDGWPEDKVTRKARKGNKNVCFCPPVPAARIQDLFSVKMPNASLVLQKMLQLCRKWKTRIDVLSVV